MINLDGLHEQDVGGQWHRYRDDLTGKELNKDKVKEARQEEIIGGDLVIIVGENIGMLSALPAKVERRRPTERSRRKPQ